ncbi:hypothetical protein [Mesorhizobium sp. LjNodule214]|uniref:hypothetical protein n=1 Tax=Mesorhizobium sp. LjNodule214 TaxID=3342252 RepID=UPI003ECC755E
MPGTALKWVLPAAAIAEAATGVALVIVPALVGQLLLGAELAGAPWMPLNDKEPNCSLFRRFVQHYHPQLLAGGSGARRYLQERANKKGVAAA